MDFINLTSHYINIQTESGIFIDVEPSGIIARVDANEEITGDIIGIPIVRRVFGEVTGIPSPKYGIGYLVSALVLSAVKGRPDVYAPDTGSTAIRNEQGHIVAVRRLIASASTN